MAFNPDIYASKKDRHIPVILLLDVSSSMHGEPIEALNRAVQDMFDAFCAPKIEKPIKISVITFGAGGAKLHQDLIKARDAKSNWRNMDADGMTPLGAALRMAKDMVEDREYMPKDEYYKGYFILASDGAPNDNWEEPMHNLIQEGRTAKYGRFALAIGDDADENMLRQFIQDQEHDLFYARNAAEIEKAVRAISEPISTAASEAPKPSSRREEPRREKKEPTSSDDNEW